LKVITRSGKRKTAIARATVREGRGMVRINKQPLDILQPEMARLKIMEPLLICDEQAKKVNIDVVVRGGGIIGQADACRTAIARVLVEWTQDLELKDALLSYDRTLLVNDIRVKEQKKPGGRGARAKRQKSYR